MTRPDGRLRIRWAPSLRVRLIARGRRRGAGARRQAGLFVPQLITWDPESGEFTPVDGPKGFATFEEAEEAGRFLNGGSST